MPQIAKARVRSPSDSTCVTWWTTWHLDRLICKYFGFALSLSFHQSPKLVFVFILILSEGQAGKAGKSSIKNFFLMKQKMLLRISESSGQKCWPTFQLLHAPNMILGFCARRKSGHLHSNKLCVPPPPPRPTVFNPS